MKTKLLIFIGLLAACNLTANPAAFTYIPERVADGEWWRFFTHAFVHVSWYHLLMDAGAFALLWHGLQIKGFKKRGLLFVSCLLGSVIVATLTSPLEHGLCGLSGVAHGLMIFSALEYIAPLPIGGTGSTPSADQNTDRVEPVPPLKAPHHDTALRRCGWITVAAVALKSIWEAATGNVLFAGLHFGDIANPVATCHAGGTLGALLAWLIIRLSSGTDLFLFIKSNKVGRFIHTQHQSGESAWKV